MRDLLRLAILTLCCIALTGGLLAADGSGDLAGHGRIEVEGAVWRPFLGVDDVRSVRANLAAQTEDQEEALL